MGGNIRMRTRIDEAILLRKYGDYKDKESRQLLRTTVSKFLSSIDEKGQNLGAPN